MPTLKLPAFALLGALTLPAVGAQPVPTPSPAWQEGAISMAIALNKRLSPYNLTVAVQDGQARLSGRVENQQDKDLAGDIAHAVMQGGQVDNRLALDAALGERPPTRQSMAQNVEDATLAATIRAKLDWNAATHGSPLLVSADAGVVTLKGRAQTAQAKQLAGVLAGNTDGVVLVSNLISLGASNTQTTQAEVAAKVTEAGVTDAWITSKVKASFLYDRNLDALSIDVATRDGVVTLSGEVASNDLRAQAMQAAGALRGVRGVNADLLKVALPAAG